MIEKLYKMRLMDNPEAAQLLRRLRRLGYEAIKDIRLEHVLCAEGISSEELKELRPLFCYPVLEAMSSVSMLDKEAGPIREIAYQRAMTDPEMPSFLHAAGAIGITSLKWARLATRYQFVGASDDIADEIVLRFLCNQQVQTIIPDGEEWTTLMPQGEIGGVAIIDLVAMGDNNLQQLSDERRLHMPLAQLRAMRRFFGDEGRLARDAEIEMIAAAWSDHCSHTTWKSLGLLQKLQETTQRLNHPLVLSAFVDNSGVMRFYEGWALNVKGETHISPTFAGSPYGGIMTKHGGVIRDIIFTGQGAWPWAGTTIMATCDPRMPWPDVPAGAFHPQVVVHESIRGTKDYTNPMGIPMAWSKYLIDERNWKGFALGHSVGVLPESRALKGQPQPGDYVVLIGGPTGNDGLHGATVSSAKMTAETSTVDAAHVQIGMPIAERVFMEAVPVLRDADCIRACTDCGAAGFSSAVGEMGAHAGVWVNLAWVPLKCASMKPWQIWLSESQERGVLCVPPEKLDEALRLLADYEVPAAVIGIFTDSNRCQVVYDKTIEYASWSAQPRIIMSGEAVVDLPYSFLNTACPLPDITIGSLKMLQHPICQKDEPKLSMPKTQLGWLRLIGKHLGHFNISDQSAAAHQFDQTVQGNTVIPYIGGVAENMPDELFAATPVRGKPWGAGIASATTQFWCDVSPHDAAELLMAQAMARLVAAGFSPDDITCCVNVYTPPVVGSAANAARLVDLVDGYAHASEVLKMPVISGKDSSSGRFTTAQGEHVDAPLTLSIMALGRLIDAWHLIRKPFKRSGDTILLYSPGNIGDWNLGGSVILHTYGYRGDRLPTFQASDFRLGMERYAAMLEEVGYSATVHSRSVVAEGGLTRRLFEMSIGSRGLGCRISVAHPGMLFAERPAIILAVAAGKTDMVRQLLGQDCSVIGAVTDTAALEVFEGQELLFSADLEELGEKWRQTFKEVVS